MTAASGFCGATSAYLLSDTASFAENGEIVEFRSKVIASDRLRLAAVMGGEECIAITDEEHRFSPANDAAALLESASTQAEFLAKLPSVMRSCHALLGGVSTKGYFQFTIARWNTATDEPETYVVGTPGHTFEGLPPFTLAGAASIMPRVGAYPSADPKRAELRALARQQRRTRWPDGTFRVGGSAELTTVDATGVRTETLCRWPDRVGTRINPRPSVRDRLAMIAGFGV